MRNKAVVLMALVALAIMASSCHEVVLKKYSVRADGTVLNREGKPVTNLGLKWGTVVQWCNETDLIVVIRAAPAILGGKETIRLRPGDCVERRVLSAATTSPYETQVVTEDGEEEGQGGGTIKVPEEGDD